MSELPQRFQEVLGFIFGEVIPESCGATTPTGASFAVYRNMDMNDLDVEIGVPAEGACALPGSLVWSETPWEPLRHVSIAVRTIRRKTLVKS